MTGAELFNLRKRFRLTQDDLATMLEVDRRTIIHYEQRGKVPRMAELAIKSALKEYAEGLLRELD